MRKGRENARRWLAGCVLSGLGVVCAAPATAAESSGYAFTLANDLLPHLFPNSADPTMPSYYDAQSGFAQTLQDSMQRYIESSLARDGIDGSVAVAAGS